jgi:hypothetical protein
VDRYSFSVWLFHPQHLAGFNGALQAAQKDPEARRANHKDESGNLKAEFIFQFS